MKILLGDFNAKVGREDHFKPSTGNETLNQNSNKNGVIIAIFATSKIMVVKSTMFLQGNILKDTWTSLDGKTHNQIDHILIDRRWSSILDVRGFRRDDCDTDQYLVIAKVWKRFNLRKLNELEIRTQCQIEITKKVCSFGELTRQRGHK